LAFWNQDNFLKKPESEGKETQLFYSQGSKWMGWWRVWRFLWLINRIFIIDFFYMWIMREESSILLIGYKKFGDW
jgi:hypothetical protein